MQLYILWLHFEAPIHCPISFEGFDHERKKYYTDTVFVIVSRSFGKLQQLLYRHDTKISINKNKQCKSNNAQKSKNRIHSEPVVCSLYGNSHSEHTQPDGGFLSEKRFYFRR